MGITRIVGENSKMLTKYICFLDEEKYLTVQLFEFLAHKEHGYASINVLKEELGLSQYQLNKLAENALTVGQQFDDVEIQYNKSKGIIATGVTTQILKRIISLMAQESLRLQIFVHDYLNYGGKSTADFVKKVGISRATFFRSKAALSKALETQLPVSIKNDEIRLRFYIFDVLYYFSYTDYIDSPKVKSAVTDLLRDAILIWKLSLSNTQRKQLLYFISIVHLRTLSGNTLTDSNENNIMDTADDPRVRTFAEIIKKQYQLPQKQALRDSRYFMTFLTTNDLLEEKNFLQLKNLAEIKYLTQKQCVVLEEELQINTTKPEYESFVTSLFKINAKTLSPSFFNNSFIDPKQIFFFQESYPQADQIALSFVELCAAKSGILLDQEELTQLYYSYLFNILNEIPINIFRDKVKIAIDFSQGAVYTKYIYNQVKQFDNLNIVITNSLSNDCDIYLSNIYDPLIKKRQVIWENPPLAEDWAFLGDVIVDVKQKKYGKTRDEETK